MKVEVKQGEGLVREVSVEIPAERVQAEIEKKFQEKQRTVTLKGFRKGKAPMPRIKSLFADEVKADVFEELFKETYPAAVKEHELRVASRPTLTDLNFADDGGMRYTATVEVFPEVGTIKYDGLEAVSTPVEISDEEVNNVIEYLRKRSAEQREVTREAREGDVVVADLKKVADPNLVLQTDSFPNSSIDLGNQMTIREFREQIPGLKAGESKEIEVVYPDDYSDAAFAGAHITYLVTVKQVKEQILPELTDAFAKHSGQVETVLELRLKIREDLKKQREEMQSRAHKREIVRQMVERNAIQIPEGMVHDYLDAVAEDFRKENPQATAQEEQELRTHYREPGIENMRWDIIWRHLADQEHIEVLPADTEKWIQGFAARNQITPEQATEVLNRSGRLNGLRDSLREEKVLDFLLDKAKLVHNEPK